MIAYADWRERQSRIATRTVKLRKLIRAGLLVVPETKSAMRAELELLCVGHPVTVCPIGASGFTIVNPLDGLTDSD